MSVSYMVFPKMTMPAFSPPAGIPSPSFGIDEVAPAWPAGWPDSQVDGYYYIDNMHPNATDSGNTYGYPNKPRVSIPTTYPAGSYVEIHGGPYTGNQLIITANGTQSQPVWIRGASNDNKPTIRRETIIKGSYVILENLYYDTGGATIGLRFHNDSSLHHAAVRSCEFSGPGVFGNGSVISIYGNSLNMFHDIVVYANHIHDFGDDNATSENDYHGVKPSGYCYDIWILNNSIHNMGGDSVQVGEATLPTAQRPNRIYVGGNTGYGNYEDGIDIKACDNIIVSQNELYGHNGNGVVIHNGPNNVWILNNKVHSVGEGIITTGSSNTYFIGNVVYNIHHTETSWSPDNIYQRGSAFHVRGTTSTTYIVNNTVFDYDTGIQDPTVSVSIFNNIFSGRAESLAYDIYLGSSSAANISDLDYNLFYYPGGSARIRWGDGVTRGLAGFKSYFSKGTHCPSEADPIFASETTANLHIQSNSPAIDAGTSHAAYNTFYSLYGLSIAKDPDGRDRPMGAGWDIGAYEFPGSVKKPNPPGNIGVR
jgi:hypothetical protein